MPFTLAHPAAILPFRRWCPHVLSFPSLVIGSLVPDVGNCFNLDIFAHSLFGSLTLCLPLGLVAVAAFYRVRYPLVLTLPSPHRELLLPMCKSSHETIAVCIVSLLVGIWGHLAWDLFTHDHSWLAQWLNNRFTLAFQSYEIPFNRIAWLVSTIGGCALIFAAYCRFWRRHRPIDAPGKDNRRAVLFWVSLILIPALFAVVITYVIYVLPTDRSIKQYVREIAEFYFPFLYMTLWLAGEWRSRLMTKTSSGAHS
jgi:hypothetical protein